MIFLSQPPPERSFFEAAFPCSGVRNGRNQFEKKPRPSVRGNKQDQHGNLAGTSSRGCAAPRKPPPSPRPSGRRWLIHEYSFLRIIIAGRDRQYRRQPPPQKAVGGGGKENGTIATPVFWCSRRTPLAEEEQERQEETPSISGDAGMKGSWGEWKPPRSGRHPGVFVLRVGCHPCHHRLGYGWPGEPALLQKNHQNKKPWDGIPNMCWNIYDFLLGIDAAQRRRHSEDRLPKPE